MSCLATGSSPNSGSRYRVSGCGSEQKVVTLMVFVPLLLHWIYLVRLSLCLVGPQLDKIDDSFSPLEVYTAPSSTMEAIIYNEIGLNCLSPIKTKNSFFDLSTRDTQNQFDYLETSNKLKIKGHFINFGNIPLVNVKVIEVMERLL